jgi:threonine dehydrogenase-like Zn-dependent dehydrogenase
MRATVMYGAGDVRVETVPDARLIEPTDALVVVTRAAICGSDLWPYKKMEHSETGRLDKVPDGYRAMNEREAIKVVIEF